MVVSADAVVGDSTVQGGTALSFASHGGVANLDQILLLLFFLSSYLFI